MPNISFLVSLDLQIFFVCFYYLLYTFLFFFFFTVTVTRGSNYMPKWANNKTNFCSPSSAARAMTTRQTALSVRRRSYNNNNSQTDTIRSSDRPTHRPKDQLTMSSTRREAQPKRKWYWRYSSTSQQLTRGDNYNFSKLTRLRNGDDDDNSLLDEKRRGKTRTQTERIREKNRGAAIERERYKTTAEIRLTRFGARTEAATVTEIHYRLYVEQQETQLRWWCEMGPKRFIFSVEVWQEFWGKE